MNVKPGYKQTEVGVIPENWQVETINQLLEDKSILGHLDGNHGELYPRSSEFKQHGVPYIGANDFSEGFVTFERCKFLSKERATQFRKGVAKDGDVLFAHNATVGPVALLKTSESFVILSTTATYFRCNEEKLSNIYLKSALQSPHFVKQYQAVMAQSTRFQVPITAQRKLSLVIPPVPEQRAIAGALSDVDALIGALDQLIAKKRDLKQAAMQQLLTGQKRLPGFHGEWEEQPLASAIAGLDTGVSVNSVEDELDVDSYEFAVLKTSAVENGCFLPAECKKIAPKDLYRVKLNPRAESILISRMNTIDLVGECGYVGADHPGLFVPDRLWMTRFHPESRLSARWLSYVLSSSEYRRRVRSIATGTSGSMKNIAKGKFLSLRLRFPSPEEQSAIAEVLSDMDAELAALEQRRDKTRALKQGMMQELLTGRTRLPVAL